MLIKNSTCIFGAMFGAMRSTSFGALLTLFACAIKEIRAPFAGCLMGLLAACSNVSPTSPSPTAPSPGTIALARDAAAIKPQLKQPATLEFLRGADTLTPQFSRVVYTDTKARRSISPAQYEALKGDERAAFAATTYDENFYFATYYGSPLAYARAVEIAAASGIASLNNTRILDIGYGAIGGPRMLAGAGAQVSAIDVDSLLSVLYRETSDQGSINGFDGRKGSLALFDGVFAGNTTLTRSIGKDYNLIITKNTMKRGFMKPESEKKALVSFDASDEVLLDTIYDTLAPGGVFLIYNITGALNPAKPSTDGRSPFTAEQFTKANLKVLAIDTNDDSAVRAMGKALGWDKQMGDLDQNLFALYTVVQRPK